MCDDCFRIPVLFLALFRWGVYDVLDASASDASHLYLEPAADPGAPDIEVGQPALLASGGISRAWGVFVWGGLRVMDVTWDSGFNVFYR